MAKTKNPNTLALDNSELVFMGHRGKISALIERAAEGHAEAGPDQARARLGEDRPPSVVVASPGFEHRVGRPAGARRVCVLFIVRSRVPRSAVDPLTAGLATSTL